MISPRQTKENKIICKNYSSALGTLKEKLYHGDHYTSTNSSVCVAYNRRIHRYQVFSGQDNSVLSTNENPRSKENYDTIRILDIPTSSDDFDKYIESQMELAKLNNNLSDRISRKLYLTYFTVTINNFGVWHWSNKHIMIINHIPPYRPQ